jgi:isopentenyl-diphosphate delta-isomerase
MVSPNGAPVNGAPVTARRKAEHIRINLQEDVGAKGVSPGWERYRFVHAALPELNLKEVELSTSFLGHRLAAPILISSMTGGVEEAGPINRNLAVAAQALGCAMGLGSCRAGIEDGALARYYQVRDVAPDVLLMANLGAVQFNYGYGVDQCRRAVEMVGAQALILHLNPLQEAVQSEGDTDFSGLLARIAQVCSALSVPVIVKEVGWGISAQVARQLQEAGVAAIDVAGAGGTSWSEVERYRARTPQRAEIAAAFAGWGIPTVDSLIECRAACLDLPLVASGGVNTGLDAAKALALGADLVGLAGRLLRAAAVSEEAAVLALEAVIEELRITMFATGLASLSALAGTPALRPV